MKNFMRVLRTFRESKTELLLFNLLSIKAQDGVFVLCHCTLQEPVILHLGCFFIYSYGEVMRWCENSVSTLK